MASITLVAESKLYLKDNLSLYNYFDDYSKLFNFLVRRTIHHLRHNLNGESESEYRTRLMSEFNITNRMAKAIVNTAKNQLSLLKELSCYQYGRLYKRKRSLQKKIEKLKLSLNSNRLKRRKTSKSTIILDPNEAKQGKPTNFKWLKIVFDFRYKASIKNKQNKVSSQTR